jgi:hypothetical protein
MAGTITGVFEADFSKFHDAASQANVSLKGFQDNGDKVQASLNRIGDSFSVRQDHPVISSAPSPS